MSATASGETIGYSYDGLGRRVARTGRTGTHQYFYTNPEHPFQVSAVRDPAGVFTVFYYDTTGAPFAMKRGASTFYVASDHLGTPRVVTDSSGHVVKRMEYDSFGYLKNDSNPAFDLPMGFAGGIRDAATGLIRFGYRDYDPANERWVSRDPILFQSGQPNLYQYVHNSPINYSDPTGLGPKDKLYGLPADFWHWYHRKSKEGGDPDIPQQEARELYEEWKDLGKPKRDHKGKHRACKVDETTYTGLPEGMGTLIPLLWPSLAIPASPLPIRLPIPQFGLL